MTGYSFSFQGADLIARASGALHWQAEALLVVSDLHLGKSERMARRGGALLPPYDTRETLARLDAEIGATNPRRVVCLGDSFDDLDSADSLDDDDRLSLLRLMAGRDWIWIEGNHDAGPVDIGGSHKASVAIGPLTFHHIVDGTTGEIGGHFHPKARIGGTTRPCFLIDPIRVILPAFGAYTGGLHCDDPALCALMDPGAIAVLTGATAIAMPMPRAEAHRRPRASSLSR